MAAASAWSRSAMMSSLMLDADGQADGFRRHAGLALFGFRHLAMGGGGGMAGQRLGVADIDQPLDQAQRVIEILAGLESRP